MEKIITKICLFRWGVKKWQDEVNKALEGGDWKLGDCYISQPRIKLICYARLYKATKPESVGFKKA